MSRMPWPAYLWPGLPQLARDGNWAALALAVAAGVILNAVFLGTCFWSDVFDPAPRIICWGFVGAAWGMCVVYSAWSDRRNAAAAVKTARANAKTFEESLDEYLKGNWFEAERKLNHLLRRNEQDLEARLLLATLMRHTRRYHDATHQLNLLERLDGALCWALEIHREGELLTAASKHNISSDHSEQESKGDN